MSRTHPLGDLKRLIENISHNDLPGSRETCGRDGQNANRTAAGHQYTPSENVTGSCYGV
jgi:hypothetical protein